MQAETRNHVHLVDVAYGKSEQLVALLTLATGDGHENFSNLSTQLQHSLLCLAVELAAEINAASREVSHV